MARPPKDYGPVAKQSIPLSEELINKLEKHFDFDEQEIESVKMALGMYRAWKDPERFPHLHMKKPERDRRMERLKKDPDLIEKHPDHWTADELNAIQTDDYSTHQREKPALLKWLTQDLYRIYQEATGRTDKYEPDGFLLLIMTIRKEVGLDGEDKPDPEVSTIQQIKDAGL